MFTMVILDHARASASGCACDFDRNRPDAPHASNHPGFVRLADPRRFRHYRHRRPRWVKLPALITRYAAFRALPDATKAHALLVIPMLERAGIFGPGLFPNHPDMLAEAIGASEPVDVDALVRIGILERCQRPDWT